MTAMMASLSETRERLCHAIASLSTDAAMNDVCRALDPILESFERENASLTEFHADGGVTPLMVACDKAQEACIEWISNKNRRCPDMTSLLGSPLDHAESGNAPMHYASSAGCLPAINLLCGMLDDDDETDRLSRLASQRNDNCDTPIILAAFRGHVAFLRQMHVLLREENGREATRFFELPNADGHTALSLSCGHGHVEVVNFLVGEVEVSVTYDIVKQAEKTLKRINEALDRVTMTKEHRARRNDVSRCVVILKVSLAKSAQASMEQLLANEDSERERKAKAEQKPRNKKPKRKKRREMSADRDIPLNNNPAMIVKASKDDNSDSDIGTPNGANQSHITVKAHQDAKQSTRVVDDVKSEDVAEAQTETDNDSLSMGPSRNDIDVDLDVDAIIEALCLDASMLLLNPRDMAANLSPCQLDAIAAVLRNQIQALE